MGRHYQRGIALYQLKRYREAVDAFTEEIIEQPYSGDAIAMRAASWLNFGNVRNAQRDIMEALRVDPNIGYSHYVLSCVRSSQGRPREAEVAIRTAMELEHCLSFFFRLAEIYFAQSRFAEAMRVVDEGLAMDPMDSACLLMRAKCFVAQGRQQEARHCMRLVLSGDPEDPAAHQALGKLSLEAGQTAQAADSLREARRLNPISHNDREALAAAYGRLLWPFAALDRYLIRFHTWTPSRRWLLLAATSTSLLLIAVLLQSYRFITVPVFLIVFNLMAATATIDQFAIPIGMMVFRRDLDVPWYLHLWQSIRIIYAVLVHAIVSSIAILCAVQPAVASLFVALIPNVELIVLLIRKSLFEAIVLGGLAFFVVFMPVGLACAFLVDLESILGAAICWSVGLTFSYIFTVYWR